MVAEASIPLYQNNLYKVMVGDSQLQEKSMRLYKVINKNTGVVEVETTVLASALEEADNLVSYYDAVLSRQEQQADEQKALN